MGKGFGDAKKAFRDTKRYVDPYLRTTALIHTCMACTNITSHTYDHYERERERERKAAFVGILSDGLIFSNLLGGDSDIGANLGDTKEGPAKREAPFSPPLWWRSECSLDDVTGKP